MALWREQNDLNGAGARRFRRRCAVAPPSGPVAATIGVTVLDPDGGTVSSEEIPRLVPKASETLGTGELSYDGRGNKAGDSIWEYEWDALDRLTAVETGTVIPAQQRVKVTFAYDYAGRRATKTVYHWDGADWSGTAEYVRKFIWNGWLLQAEADGDGKLLRSYVWGRDVSGSVGGAAGIGGLLAVRHHDPSDGSITATYWVVPDEHGSVASLVLQHIEEGLADKGTVGVADHHPHVGKQARLYREESQS